MRRFWNLWHAFLRKPVLPWIDPRTAHARIISILCATLVAGLATSAMASSEPRTRLVSCGSENCLLVSGHRDDATSPVLINGHAVTVEGKRSWRVSLPIETVRRWSAPFARSIDVSILDSGRQDEVAMQADLPIGLLGHVTNLASLVIASR